MGCVQVFHVEIYRRDRTPQFKKQKSKTILIIDSLCRASCSHVSGYPWSIKIVKQKDTLNGPLVSAGLLFAKPIYKGGFLCITDVYKDKYGEIMTVLLFCITGLVSLLYCSAVLTTLGESTSLISGNYLELYGMNT